MTYLPSKAVSQYYGTGADGDLTLNSTYNALTTVLDGDIKVCNYNNLSLTNSTLTTTLRCKGLLIYCKGNLTLVSGSINMSKRGSYGVGNYKYFSRLAAANNQDPGLQTLEFPAIVSGVVPAVGASGAGALQYPVAGSAGINGQTGGGGGGGGSAYSGGGAGTAGTSYSGGSAGGGGGFGAGGFSAMDYAGAGGNGNVADWADQQACGGGGGGGSGGGSIIIFYGGTFTNNGTITANGGTGGTYGPNTGGTDRQGGGGGGAGNGGGAGSGGLNGGGAGTAGQSGTGGFLAIVVAGNISIDAGSYIIANGANGGAAGDGSGPGIGGASGGAGSIQIYQVKV